MTTTRIEKDSLGEIEVRDDVYWGAQTERARRNFPVSGLVFQRRFLAAKSGLPKLMAEHDHWLCAAPLFFHLKITASERLYLQE